MGRLISEFILTFCFTSKNLGYWIEQYVLRTGNGNQAIHGQSRVEPVALTESDLILAFCKRGLLLLILSPLWQRF